MDLHALPTPGLRRLEKYAVTCGGGHNHHERRQLYALFHSVLLVPIIVSRLYLGRAVLQPKKDVQAGSLAVQREDAPPAFHEGGPKRTRRRS